MFMNATGQLAAAIPYARHTHHSHLNAQRAVRPRTREPVVYYSTKTDLIQGQSQNFLHFHTYITQISLHKLKNIHLQSPHFLRFPVDGFLYEQRVLLPLPPEKGERLTVPVP